MTAGKPATSLYARFERAVEQYCPDPLVFAIFLTVTAYNLVGEGFRGDSQAEAAMRLIGQELGLRPARNTRTRRKSPALADSQSFQALS